MYRICIRKQSKLVSSIGLKFRYVSISSLNDPLLLSASLETIQILNAEAQMQLTFDIIEASDYLEDS